MIDNQTPFTMQYENLAIAIQTLNELNPANPVSAIQFEDGSGKKFNYQRAFSNQWEYIDLSLFFNSRATFLATTLQ